MDSTAASEAERPRLIALASRMLGDGYEAQDVVQETWLRLDRTGQMIDNLPAWLTTVTSRRCLDRIKARIPEPAEPDDEAVPDAVDDVVLAETVGAALQVVLDRLGPRERVAFVLHDTLGFDFELIGKVLYATPAAARKLASRARAKIAQPTPEDALADWEVVDAFLAAARGGDLARLVTLLAPDVVIAVDETATEMGTPTLHGRDAVAAFFNGAAKTAFPAYVEDRPGAAWIDRGVARVAFDFTVEEGVVRRIDFRADPGVLQLVTRRHESERRTATAPTR